MRSNKLTGFTIVELLVVLAVVGILAGITVVGYSNVQKKARTSSSIVSASHTKKKVETYSAETGTFPTAPSQLTGAAITKSYYLNGVTFATATASNPQALTFISCGASVGVKIGYYDDMTASTVYFYTGSANSTNCVGTTGLTT